jgi:hypothetical protein
MRPSETEDMSYFASNAQVKTAALLASTFLSQFYLTFRVVQFMGPVGSFLAGAMVDGSPVVWLGERIIYILGIRIPRGPATLVLLYLLVLPPYPLMGWLIGYRWPLRDASLGWLLLAVLFRFVLVWVPMVAIGLWLVLSE